MGRITLTSIEVTGDVHGDTGHGFFPSPRVFTDVAESCSLCEDCRRRLLPLDSTSCPDQAASLIHRGVPCFDTSRRLHTITIPKKRPNLQDSETDAGRKVGKLGKLKHSYPAYVATLAWALVVSESRMTRGKPILRGIYRAPNEIFPESQIDRLPRDNRRSGAPSAQRR